MVSGAIANQTQWIREAQPGAKIITYLWQELLELFKSGVSTASLLGRVLSLSLSLSFSYSYSSSSICGLRLGDSV